ncbi:Carbohydrate kinase, FGGY family, partial [hydrothermal vent metagenome]
EKKSWPAWLNKLNVNIKSLPDVFTPGSVLAPISQNIISKYQLNSNCKIISGTTDSIAAFIASGANKPGDAVTSLGSTLVLKIITEQPIYSAEFGIYSHRLGDYWLAGGASNTGGAVLAHYFNSQQIKQLSDLIHPEKNTQLNYYPLLQNGERFPVNDPDLKPRLQPKAKNEVDFFQGILEGISQIELAGYKKLHALGAPYPTQIISAGGGSKNTAWTKMREQMLKVSIKTAQYSEACYGSALLARRVFL